jgi:hypothetical protein
MANCTDGVGWQEWALDNNEFFTILFALLFTQGEI